MRIFYVLLASLMMLAVNFAAASEQPNIIFILADDLGYGDLGCYGQKIVPTPNIDRMAAEGTRFTNAYAGASSCAPSRCSLLTGLHAGHMTVRSNGGRLTENDTTIAGVLKNAGYATAGFGKWHLGRNGDAGDPLSRGFDRFVGIDLHEGGNISHFCDELHNNGKPEPVEANRNGKQGRFGDDLFIDEALKFVRENRAKPFFVYLALRTPHKPLESTADAMKQYLGKFEEKPFKGDGQVGPCPAPRAARAAMIAHMDEQIPRVLDAIKELKLDGKTLVIFTSDNGPAGAGGADPKFFNSAGELRGMKFSLWEGGIREPFIAWWPGVVPAGKTCDLPFAFCDMMPTFAELAHAECPKTDGLSIVPAIKGDMRSQKRHEYLYWEQAGSQAVRMANWKAMRSPETDEIMLYDLAVDPGEKQDVASKNADVVARVRAIVKAAHVDNQKYPLVAKVKKAEKE